MMPLFRSIAFWQKKETDNRAISPETITAVILAGGQGKRMGGEDKGLLDWNGRPLIATILDALESQANTILINANRNQEVYEQFGRPVVADSLKGFQGPLAGFAAGMQAAETPWIATVPCDSPLIPDDLLARLAEALMREQAEIAVAHDGERMQPVYALLPVGLFGSLLMFLQEGNRKIDLWYKRHKIALADFSDRPEIFRNVNTPEEHSKLQEEAAD